MTQKEKLIELIDKSDIPLCDECGENPVDTRIEALADFLLDHGCFVFDEDKIDDRYLPLISKFWR